MALYIHSAYALQAGMAAAKETFGSYADLEEGPPAWHKPGDAR